jgi:hypothetical protein
MIYVLIQALIQALIHALIQALISQIAAPMWYTILQQSSSVKATSPYMK